MKRLLLISNSTSYGGGYLEHCEAELREFLGAVRRLLFVPYALADHDGYVARARARFEQLGFGLDSIHEAGDRPAAVAAAEAIFIGGGNTFRLLKRLYDEGLIEPIRSRVERGAPYVGTSAGSNVACITIKTTNDMPIVQPPSFDALKLVPFNLNPHYLDPDPASRHMGETRELRINEFHEENTPIVVALRESAMLRIEGSAVTLTGTTGARVFRRGQSPQEFEPGASMEFLLG